MSTFSPPAAVTGLTYPRTGKRGVPQQFPRRLYEMLQSEDELRKTDTEHKSIITWSDSGRAFRIHNVSLFASQVLPKYFRTSKFSSFQRNLNLVSHDNSPSLSLIHFQMKISNEITACLASTGFQKLEEGLTQICTRTLLL